MSTLIVKNVDLLKLEEQRKTLSGIDRSRRLNSNQIEAIDGIQNMLDNWSDQRYHSSLGSKTNQEAKDRQQSLLPWYTCPECDTDGTWPTCPRCGSNTIKTEYPG